MGIQRKSYRPYNTIHMGINHDYVRFQTQFTANVAECTSLHIITKLYYSQQSRLLITSQMAPISA
jgi:hypothetical protein